MKKRSRFYTFLLSVIAIFAIIAVFADDVGKQMRLGLDLQGGFEIVYEIEPLKEGDELPDMSSVAQAVSKRIDILGVNEPDIQGEGDNRIRVQLAGVNDIEQARTVISSTANLSFRDVDDNLLMDATVLKKGGAALSSDSLGKPAVSLKIADQDLFYEVTSELAQKSSGENMIVTWLDFVEGEDSYDGEKVKENPKYISVAGVSEAISGDAIINGSFTKEEAKQLADLINSGSLPFQMKELYSEAVTASFGEQAFETTMFAGGIGIALIMLFMIVYYRLPGLISAISIAAYVFVVFFIYNLMGGVFTLSGLAALVLGVGMAVDSSIITFERIKDALYSGRSIKSAFYEGTSKSFWTIFDSQLTTFISAIILFALGSGSVKGFATMLIVSVVATITLIVGIVRFLLGQLVESGMLDGKLSWFGVKKDQVANVAKGEERFYFGFFHRFQFVKNAKYFVATSLAIIVIAIGCMGFSIAQGKGPFHLGIDFVSGTKITVQSDQKLNESDLKADLARFDIEPSTIQINGENKTSAEISITDVIDSETMQDVKAYLKDTYGYPASDNVVTPVIGRDLVKSAILISILAWIGILIYVSFRFKWDYAISGIVALLHDVIIILAACAILRLEVNTEIVAVLLTIVGYSINNSIVVFDRIRDYMKGVKPHEITKERLITIVNSALGDTALRSLFSTFTTMLPVICLLFMGSKAIFNFNLLLIVGLVAGGGSSMFIAAQLWCFIRLHHKPKQKKRKKAKKLDELTEMIIPGVND